MIRVNPLDVVPLCKRAHDEYDGRRPGPRLDLLPYLTTAEQARAVEVLGSIMSALVHIGGGR